MAQLVLALEPGSAPVVSEPWVLPEDLEYARAEEHVDLLSVCRVASHILFMLSGRRFGVRTETLRPMAGGSECYRAPLHQSAALGLLTLKSPVQGITSVKIDGRILDASEYVLYDNRTLVRTGGLGWPVQQRLELPDTAVGTFSVTYQWGQSVPEGGVLAAKVFATELAKYVNKDGSALPDRTVSISRQGITQTLLDPSEFVKQARTGLYLPDLWLGSVNPRGIRKRPVIASPESIGNVRST